MRRVDAGSLARYADAIVRDGLLIGSGDVLAVHPEPIQRELAIALTEAGYRAGARYVDVLETDPRITRARALLAPEDTLDWRPSWEDARMRELVREGAGIVWIAGSENPQALADVPPARAVRRVTDRAGLPPYRRAVGRADARFAVVAWPTPAWAAQVYPELESDAAVATLGNDLLRFARLGADDPPERLAAARGAPRRARRAAHRARSARDPAEGARHRSPPRAPGRDELARRHQRRAGPSDHAEHPHGRGLHEPRPVGDERAVPLHAAARARGSHDLRHRRRVPARAPRAHRGRRRGRPRVPRRLSRTRPRRLARWASSRSSTTPRASARPAARISRRCSTRTPRRTSRSVSDSVTAGLPARRRSIAPWCTSTS